jgi:hypothetical protein
MPNLLLKWLVGFKAADSSPCHGPWEGPCLVRIPSHLTLLKDFEALCEPLSPKNDLRRHWGHPAAPSLKFGGQEGFSQYLLTGFMALNGQLLHRAAKHLEG